ncbi:MAG: glycoside hydrolase family 127 protein [Planctomycetota bacterium]|jgi:DUF1680 family protein
MRKQAGIKRDTPFLFSVSFVLAGILVCPAAWAMDPSYYVKKATWQETMRAARQTLTEFEEQELRRQAARLKELGVKLGPWYTIGPFGSPNQDPYGVVFGPELKTNLKKTYEDGKLKWTRKPQWLDGVVHRLPGDAPSGEGRIVANYMYREITVPRAAKLPVYLGSNDGIQVWFNAQRVLAHDIGRRAAPDQEAVNLNFRPGANKLLIKVNNRAAGHAFYFSLHPGGGVRTRRKDELWVMLRRDFPGETPRRQMNWEQEDDIWDRDCDPADLPALADRYAKATRDIATLSAEANRLAATAKTSRELQNVREVYYRSRLYDASIKGVERKLRLVKNQFAYLRSKFKEQKGDPLLKEYQTTLESLSTAVHTLLAGAEEGDLTAIDKLPELEDKLLKLHRSHLPRIPIAPRDSACFPFDLRHVRLLDGPFKRAMELDRKYLYDLESDRLLHMFRVTAGLPSSAKQLGGWEKREVRGHTMGHYLSACALMYASTGDEKLKTKADALVAELAKCQKALGNGYLGAFPEEGIKKVIYGTGNYWAPWYTYHKIVAGMLDMYNHCGNRQALEVATAMAAWTKMHLDNLNEEQTQMMLRVEFGGMNEVLCNLYAVTRNPDHLTLARRFDHKAVFEPLAHFQDELKGLHVNTQVPKIIGAAREFELTGQPYYYNIATFFWDQVVNARSYCTGGTSNHEHWRTGPYVLAKELSPATQETCCTYNMLKLTRHLFCWNPDARYGDYYERALFNSILSTQDPETGMMMYFVPLASGYWKIFNTPNDSFWCCTGTGLENHAKYGDSIYFHNDKGVYVNLFIASELDWPAKGIRIRQKTAFPEEQGTTLIIKAANETEFALNIRIPYWATNPVTVAINGKKPDVRIEPASYITLKRTWKDGDRVKVTMPMSLHLDRMPDDANLAAIMYGPLVLAGELGTEGLNPKTLYAASQGVLRNIQVDPGPDFVADPENLDSWIKPIAGRPLNFRTVNAGRPKDVTLVPFHRLFGRRYAIYWRLQPKQAKE